MKKISYLILLLLFVVPSANAQDSTLARLQSFVKNINTYNHLYPQEKVFLHFDNTAYHLGENIWFKAYVVVAENHQPTVLSRVLYVELLTPEGDVIDTKKLKIENGQCHGDFFLEKEVLYAGFYEVRAYTRQMLNWGEDVVFSRVFPIYDQPENGKYQQTMRRVRSHRQVVANKRLKQEKKDNLNIQFLPEGGSLVGGLLSRVAFKGTDREGRSLSLSGHIQGNNKDTVATFSTAHQGMGSFSFTPKLGEKYSAVIQYNGKEHAFDLPETQAVGCVMTVDNAQKDTLNVQIRSSSTLSARALGLSVSCRGRVDVFTVVESDNVMLRFPKQDLTPGVTQITLFDDSGMVHAERLVFIPPQEKISMQHQLDKEQYAPYEKVSLSFVLANQTETPLETTFSVAVRDNSNGKQSSEEDMATHFLLSSDLKGHIEDAGYYFEVDDPEHRQHLDLLLLTQGWRRYSWKQMADMEPVELQHYIEKGIVIDGRVLSSARRKPKEGVEVSMWMYSDQGISQQGTCLTDADGRFNFLPNDFDEKWNLSLQTKEKGKRKDNRVILNRTLSPNVSEYSFYEKHPSERMKVQAEQPVAVVEDWDSVSASFQNLLPETLVEDKPRNRRGIALRFANIVYDVQIEIDRLEDKEVGYTGSIHNFLSKVNPYFNYTVMPDGTYEILYKGRVPNFIINNDSLPRSIYRGNLSMLSVEDIESIIVSEEPVASVYIYTYQDGGTRKQKGIRQTYIQGYSLVRKFYSPDYSEGVLPGEMDFRRTLYWNPNVATDKNGRATVSFYNNGSKSSLSVSANGLTANGRPIIIRE